MLRVRQIPTASFSLLSYVIHDDASGEAIIVDPPLSITRQLNLDSLRVKALINTHIHPDHTMGNRSLSRFAPARAHPSENAWYLRVYNALLTAVFTGRLPSRISFTLEDNERIALGDACIQVMHTPGHSPGSICLYWDGNLVSGDTVFAEGIGRTDLPGGSMGHLKKSLARITGLPEETIIWPGHSYGNRTKASLSEIMPFLSWVMNTM